MPRLSQYDYIFGIGTCFAFLDAYNIGANDVANSFATSVSSKSLTLRQACVAAALCEFLGAVLVGARVASTIKNGIISNNLFEGEPGVQMLAFFCALVASSCWLTFATYKSFPVSTTYSIVSALAGVGIALGGVDSVQWGWNGGSGLATIFAGFGIAPSIAAGFGAIIFLLAKYVVLVRKDSAKWALYMGPFWFFATTAVLTMVIVYKGSPSLGLNKLSEQTTALAITMTALVISVLSLIFWVPYVRAKSIKKDYTIRFYHFFMGPLLWNRPAPADAGLLGSKEAVPDYRVGHYHDETVQTLPETSKTLSSSDSDVEKSPTEISPAASNQHNAESNLAAHEGDERKIIGAWILPRNLWIILRYKVPAALLHGSSVDIHKRQMGGKDAQKMAEIHARAVQYPNATEHVFSFLQVLTACTASFAHGANDVSNAIAPYSAIYQAWSTGVFVGKNADVPVWILAFGGAAIVIGLATYGYNIMSILGNKLTMHSPSRGFSMELGAAITVVLASQYGIPVSTTMCITGSTLGVALMNNDLRAFNWKALGWIVLGWVLTVPIAGIAGYCVMAFILNAPHFNSV